MGKMRWDSHGTLWIGDKREAVIAWAPGDRWAIITYAGYTTGPIFESQAEAKRAIEDSYERCYRVDGR